MGISIRRLIDRGRTAAADPGAPADIPGASAADARTSSAAPPAPPLPRTWRAPAAVSEARGPADLLREHPRAVAVVLLGASALGVTAAHATTAPSPSAAADGEAVDLARAHLFADASTARASTAPASTAPTRAASALAPSTTAPAAYDVATTSTAELTRLERAGDGSLRRLAATVKNARTAYADMLAQGARLTVVRAPGNGHQPVLVLVPAQFDPAQPARVHTHYHGWSSTVAEPLGHSAGTGARLRALQAADPQRVFVLPEAGNAPAQRGSYQTDWSNVVSEAATTEQALTAVGVGAVSERVVSAHSGGGAALARALTATPDGAGLVADRLELLDCLYGSEAALTAWAGTPSGQAVTRVTYYLGTNTPGRDAALAAALGARYHRVTMASQGPITEANDPTLRDGRGRAIGRTYAADPHNRTSGAFMGASAP